MATLQELSEVIASSPSSGLKDRTESAVVIAAQSISNPTAAEKSWIQKVIADPKSEASKALTLIVAKHNAESVAYFTDTVAGLTDAVLLADFDAAMVSFLVG